MQTGGASYTLPNVTANHAVNVTFTQLTYTVTPSAGANGDISPNTAQTVSYGNNITLNALPATGYTVASWTLDGTVVQTGGASYTLPNVTANHAVNVTFTQLIYTVTFTTQPSSRPAGSVISPAVQVTVLDASGNPVATAVTLALGNNPGNDTLQGTHDRADRQRRWPPLRI